MKKQTQEQLQSQIDKFNQTFKVGDKLNIRNDNWDIQMVTVSSPASILGGHSAVGWFEEFSGCYDLGRVIYS